MPSTTAAQREARRALVGFLRGMGHGPSQIARALDVSRQTVHADGKALEEAASPSGGREAAAELRAVFNRLWTPVHADLKREGLEPANRLVLTKALWAAYLERLRTEQAYGFLPKAPEQVEVGMGRETLDTLFQALVNRVSPDAQLEIATALRSLDKDHPNLDLRLGPPEEEDSGVSAVDTGRRNRRERRLGFDE
ncbi:MAG: hypothetical protein ACE5LS_04970 [Thermoplasmata archaeon]